MCRTLGSIIVMIVIVTAIIIIIIIIAISIIGATGQRDIVGCRTTQSGQLQASASRMRRARRFVIVTSRSRRRSASWIIVGATIKINVISCWATITSQPTHTASRVRRTGSIVNSSSRSWCRSSRRFPCWLSPRFSRGIWGGFSSWFPGRMWRTSCRFPCGFPCGLTSGVMVIIMSGSRCWSPCWVVGPAAEMALWMEHKNITARVSKLVKTSYDQWFRFHSIGCISKRTLAELLCLQRGQYRYMRQYRMK